MGFFGLAKKSLKQYIGGWWCACYAYSLTISHLHQVAVGYSDLVFQNYLATFVSIISIWWADIIVWF